MHKRRQVSRLSRLWAVIVARRCLIACSLLLWWACDAEYRAFRYWQLGYEALELAQDSIELGNVKKLGLQQCEEEHEPKLTLLLRFDESGRLTAVKGLCGNLDDLQAQR